MMGGLIGQLSESTSPFHEGEQRVQAALGVREEIEPWARRVVRPHLPEEHALFYSQLPFLLAAARDRRGRPWATVLAGPPGFISSPDDRSLSIATSLPKSDPLAEALEADADLGMLGIELHSRRRNRVNGRLRSVSDGKLWVDVGQTFGNCPQHIHPRAWRARAPRPQPASPRRARSLSASQRAMIENADTFFIASGHTDSESNAGRHASLPTSSSRSASDPTTGMDVSHRGGPKGFIQFESENILLIPDYAGNNHFNTLGNLVVDPRAGLLFVDFATGSLLQLTGHAEIDWERPSATQFPGAQRLIRFSIEEIVSQAQVLPIVWHEPDTGAQTLRLTQRKVESDDVVSFYFEPLETANAAPIGQWKPGQHLPIEIDLPDDGTVLQRTYSLSNAPGEQTYRISVKREPSGRVSRHLHDLLAPGTTIRAHAPAGTFTLELDEIEEERPIVLVGGGIGITPLVAMLHAIAEEQPDRRVVLVRGVRDESHHPLASEVNDLIDRLPHGVVHVRASRPGPAGRASGEFDSAGRVDVDLLESLTSLDAAEFFLCGPPGFMAELETGLTTRGVAPARIHYETF